MRRFYKTVDIAPGATEVAVTLDGKPMRSPAGKAFAMPSHDLARAIAQEWAQVPEKGEIRPQAMPLTRLAMTALDRAAAQRGQVIDDITAYGGSDLLCYRAAEPETLVARQRAAWDPLLDWVARTHGAQLTVAAGVMPVEQPREALQAFRRPVELCSDFELSALFVITTGLGSLVLSLAVLAGEISPEQASDLAEIDSSWQAERWGEDGEAAKQRLGLRADIAAAGRFLSLLRATA